MSTFVDCETPIVLEKQLLGELQKQLDLFESLGTDEYLKKHEKGKHTPVFYKHSVFFVSASICNMPQFQSENMLTIC